MGGRGGLRGSPRFLGSSPNYRPFGGLRGAPGRFGGVTQGGRGRVADGRAGAASAAPPFFGFVSQLSAFWGAERGSGSLWGPVSGGPGSGVLRAAWNFFNWRRHRSEERR